MQLKWPLMVNNITDDDLEAVIQFLKTKPRLTQSENVLSFEREWSKWLGVKYSAYVNSGASANFIAMMIIKHLYGTGEVIVPPLTWVSDISALLFNGLEPVFVDINPKNLCMDVEQVLSKINKRTRAVFITHVQGFNGLTDRLLKELNEKDIPLVEDACEAHGATFRGKKVGSFGLMSNFSFYFAHHMSTVEGGMVCTNRPEIYETARMLRSHGMAREVSSEDLKKRYVQANPQLSSDFIFAYPSFNMRGTEIGAVIGRKQLKRLDENNHKRRHNFEYFLQHLDREKYRTEFDLEGSCNYAFNLVIRKADPEFRSRMETALRNANVEFRRGSSGGGNQMRQPYLKGIVRQDEWKEYPQVEHIHFYGYYIGNYPDLTEDKIASLCRLLNGV